MKICVIQANLGDMDKPVQHATQSVEADYFTFTDDNLLPRYNAMTPRLQAKIPKMFAWELRPGYDAYLWLDGNLRLAHQESLKYFLEALDGHDIIVLKHPTHDTIHWEYRYNWRGLHSNAPSNYLTKRYANEWLDEQYEVIKSDKDYKDDLMVNGGIFMYRNTPAVQAVLKEWWYLTTRYTVFDQLSFSYLLNTSGLKINVLPDVYNDCKWLEVMRHAK